jgi:UDP-4-amino-4-deoxy-L-arabinose formyltransferase/UDP-glucuronic acid dehydrogenase (UDP-4-keto-hexauronic acid decarboxylating)
MPDGISDGAVYAGCTESGFDVFRYLHENVVPIAEVLTLTPEQAQEHDVAGYYSFQSYAEANDIDVYTPVTYLMGDERDLNHFRSRNTELLLLHGWQRLIPGEVLDTFAHGAFGLHGSAYGLPKGRGRSPMNWSLIQDLDRFLLSVMQLDEGADSGNVVETMKFDINPHDDIRTLYYKLVLAGQELFEHCIDEIEAGTLSTIPQEEEPTYYPKRIPEDGAISWADPTETIYDLIRAVTRPYPGAFTEYDSERIFIWKGQPFSDDFVFDEPPGTIVQVFAGTDDFVIATPDGSLLVTEWEASNWEPESGMELTSLPNESIDSPRRIDRPEHEYSLSSN